MTGGSALFKGSTSRMGSSSEHAAHMHAMTSDTLTKPLSELANQLNTHLQTQPAERALHRLDLCDRCPQAAQSIFTFKIEPHTQGTGSSKCDIILCGHHMRHHLSAMLDQSPIDFWIDPRELHTIRGVVVPAPDRQGSTGDGITDESR